MRFFTDLPSVAPTIYYFDEQAKQKTFIGGEAIKLLQCNRIYELNYNCVAYKIEQSIQMVHYARRDSAGAS